MRTSCSALAAVMSAITQDFAQGDRVAVFEASVEALRVARRDIAAAVSAFEVAAVAGDFRARHGAKKTLDDALVTLEIAVIRHTQAMADVAGGGTA